MADLNISQEEADELVAAVKLYEGNGAINYPPPGSSLSLSALGPGQKEHFLVDVTRGRINLSKVSHNLRVRTSIVLLRLDIAGTTHMNPDGSKIKTPHLHVYREGYGVSWAIEVPASFGDLSDMPKNLRNFLTYCNITHQPLINLELF